MATQSRQGRGPAVEVAVADEASVSVPAEVGLVSTTAEDSTVEWRRRLAEQLLERAKADGVKLVGPDGLLAGITKSVLETALQTELSEHLG